MYEPLLKPNHFESAGGYFGHSGFDVWRTKSGEACLGFRTGIRIAGIKRSAYVDQVQTGVEVGFKKNIDVDVLGDVAAATEVSADGVDAVGKG